MISELLKKYDVPVPRYTSYPTVPYWQDALFSAEAWKNAVRKSFDERGKNGISLYFHIPFCEKLCTYCACNKKITGNHAVEKPYIEALIAEWKLYIELFGKKPLIKEIHFGGGTPTFLSAENFAFLLENVFEHAEIAPDREFSLEAHPNYTNKEQLETLYRFGFRRLSVGIQDFDERVQTAINRPQSFETTRKVFDTARELGYESVNADMVYGLPFQNLAGLEKTLAKVALLRPERIAFYGYAHVPWKSKTQRLFTDEDLPLSAQKRALFELGRQDFLAKGYHEIGIDHFALDNDQLYSAYQDGSIHRNFMGYTTQNTSVLIGLGVSSISDTWTAFAQNVKDIKPYETMVSEGKFPIEKGHLLSDEDLFLRKHVLSVMCKGKTSWDNKHPFAPLMKKAQTKWADMKNDGLLDFGEDFVEATVHGKMFLRNISAAFDAYLGAEKSEKQVFSRGV
jgi:oxygen-independent coproporphyrinogen-3 oxidase